MELNIFENIQNAIEKTMENQKQNQNRCDEKIESVEIELAQKLDAIEEYSLDRWEEGKAVLENRKTREIIQVPKEELPPNITEGTILKKIKGTYIENQEQTKKVAEEIREKMNDLWK